ncbi:unnamed protein product [Effrenium voratum]|nr:unnamed protein product [Effrenium voratum]CAJ1457631.1 unnamed protein product [Effrenium voratum]
MAAGEPQPHALERGVSMGHIRSQTMSMIESLEDLYKARKFYVDLPADIYGVAIAVAVGDLPCILSCSQVTKVRLMRFIFGISTMAVNLWLQMLILWNVNQYIVQGAVHDAQTNYAQFHREIFDKDGTFQQDKWDAWNNGPYKELCNMAVSRSSFSAGIVFLWSARMLNEVKATLQLALDLCALSPLPTGAQPHQMMYEVKNESDETERFEIVAVNKLARLLLTTTVLLPKMVVAVCLTIIGCRWLAATQSFGDLILNALALEFVINIDELMYEAFTPLSLRQVIEMTKFAHVPQTNNMQKLTDETTHELLRNMFYVLALVAWSFVYLNYAQQVLPNFPHDIHDHCSTRFYEQYSLKCPIFGNPEECFPYGPQT